MRQKLTLTLLTLFIAFSSLALTPITGTPSVCAGSTRTLIDSMTGGIWISSDTSVATVGSGTGVVYGVSAGTTIITYYLSGSYVTMSFTVTPAPMAITGTTTIGVGSTTTLSDATAGGSWSSGNPAIATVNPATGVVTGVSAGTCGIYYMLTSGCGTYVVFTVTSSLSLPPIMGTPSVCVGGTRTLTDSVTGGSWTSSNTSIATVGLTSGVVTGVSAGVVTITYTHSGSFVTVSFTVNPIPAPITGGTFLCAGSTVTLADATAGGTWTSGNTSVATVTSTGVVTAVGAGLVNIYY